MAQNRLYRNDNSYLHYVTHIATTAHKTWKIPVTLQLTVLLIFSLLCIDITEVYFSNRF